MPKKKKLKIARIPLKIIPIDNDGYHLMVNAKINNKKANLLIDTGASRTVFDKNKINAFIKDTKYEIEKNEKLSTGLGTNSLQSEALVMDEFKLDKIRIKNYPAIILDMMHINQSYSRLDLPYIDGVLGGDLLNKYKAVINYNKKHLKLNY